MHRQGRTRALRQALLVGTAAAVLLTAACDGGDDEVGLADDAAPTTPTPTATSTPTPTSTPGEGGEGGTATDETPEPVDPFEDDTADVELEGAADQQTAVLDEVRIGRHDGFDRVVWEFASGDRPRLWVEYDDQPTQPGSGEPVDVAGETAIRMTASTATDFGAELYAPDHEPYDGPERVEAAATERVTEAVALGDFEANMEWAVGVDARQPFRVDVLEDPLRVILDVQH